MTLEACQLFGWPFAGIGKKLRSHPNEIAKLLKSRSALDELLRIGIHVLPVSSQHVLSAGDLARQYGLLSGDALIVAVMQAQGLKNLASNDGDFDRVPGLIRLAPV
jgi:predicted nucleic acid-binding protein